VGHEHLGLRRASVLHFAVPRQHQLEVVGVAQLQVPPFLAHVPRPIVVGVDGAPQSALQRLGAVGHLPGGREHALVERLDGRSALIGVDQLPLILGGGDLTLELLGRSLALERLAALLARFVVVADLVGAVPGLLDPRRLGYDRVLSSASSTALIPSRC
jgi:hypothetical protein